MQDARGTFVAVFAGLGDGTLAPPALYRTASAGLIGAADLDGDGRRDVLVGDSTGLGLLRGAPSGFAAEERFSLGRPMAPYDFSRLMALGDFDGDGALDVVGIINREWNVAEFGVAVWLNRLR